MTVTTDTGTWFSRSAVRSNRFQPILVFGTACAAVFLFALVPTTTRVATAQLSGLAIGLIRTVGAGLLSVPLLLVLRPRVPRHFQEWRLLVLYAFGNFAGFPLLFGMGLRHTSASHAALIMAAMPLFIGLIGITLERRLPRWSWFIGVAIAVSGETALMALRSMSGSTGASVMGDGIVFVACTLSAIGIVAGARLGLRIGPLAATLWAITLSSVCLAPWAAVRLLATPHAYTALTATTWAAIVQITLGAAVAANMLWLWSVWRGGLVRVAPIQFAQPVCALFLANALLKEPLTAPLLFVAAAILFGTVTACRGARQPQTRETADSPSLQPRLEQIVWHSGDDETDEKPTPLCPLPASSRQSELAACGPLSNANSL